MTLLEKLAKIDKPPVVKLQHSEANNIEELWGNLLVKYIPSPDIVLAWHDLLMAYVRSSRPCFAIRGYNSFPPERYKDLRRGFLTNAGEFSFFYTDNFFAAYFQKLAMDGFVPTFDELVSAFKNREFPSRFGRNTEEERALLAVKQGKDPKISTAGFKIAHIIPTGKDFNFNNQVKGINAILEEYFPKGDREDYILKEDNKGQYHVRIFESKTNAREYAIAQFLRFVHPFNYFLCPKKTCEINNKCKELAEYPVLLKYVHDYNLRTFGDKYLEFLELVMPLEKYHKPLFSREENNIFVKYGLDINKWNSATVIQNVKHKTNINSASQNHSATKTIIENYDDTTKIAMAFEYLRNPNTSFRKLETEFLHIDSPSRGGGFIAKEILNSMGIMAYHKGMLQQEPPLDNPSPSKELLIQTLEAIKRYLEEN